MGGGTPIQTACGFEDSAEEMFAYLMASCGPRPDEEKIRLYTEGSLAVSYTHLTLPTNRVV